MWSRKNLKERAKTRCSTNYWKTVLIGLVMLLAAGSASSSGGASSTISGSSLIDSDAGSVVSDVPDLIDSLDDELASDVDDFYSLPFMGFSALIVITILVVGVIVLMAFVLPLRILILNPLEIGCKRFFSKNLIEDAQAKEICYSFDYGYKQNVKTMFLRDLYTALWTLLFVIPGIVKSYEYRMIPYILGENPGMDTQTAFAISKRMMDGNKWNAFVLDLSFLGWHLLNGCTFGILGIFYLNPYVYQTDAALYDALKMQATPENNGF